MTDHDATDRGPQVFISYRRTDTSTSALLLYRTLRARTDVGRIFMDIDSIAVGRDFPGAIEHALHEADVFVALIGPEWLVATDADGTRRLDDADDFVRLEIESALGSDVPIVPVLIQGARMPARHDLPPSLAPIATINALEMSEARWDPDVNRLVDAVRDLAGTRAGGETSTGTDAVTDMQPPPAPWWRRPVVLGAIAVAVVAVAIGVVSAAMSVGGSGGSAATTTSVPPTSTTVAGGGLPTVHDLAHLTSTFGAQAAQLPVGTPSSVFVPYTAAGASLSTELPAAWNERSISPFIAADDTRIGQSLVASVNADRFSSNLDASGIGFYVTEQTAKFNPTYAHAHVTYERVCTYVGEGDVDATKAQGYYRIWKDCGPGKALLLEYQTLDSRGYAVAVVAVAQAQSDVSWISHAIRTLGVNLPIDVKFQEAPFANSDDLPGKVIE